MELYVGIDLHSNNSYVVIMDKTGKLHLQKKYPNELNMICRCLDEFKGHVLKIVVESTYNWYWLVDGLMERGYDVRLANTTWIQQYQGKKYTDDKQDARWLADLLRNDLMKEAYIYPKEFRMVRDLLRKRSSLVHQRTGNILSAIGIVSRHTGRSISCESLRKLTDEDVSQIFPNAEVRLAIESNRKLIECLDGQIKILEGSVRTHVKDNMPYRFLRSVSGVGEILASTISLETGDVRRFKKVEHYASYCRLVNSKKLSNGKKKGKGNRKNGNKYLAWAFMEATHYAIRYSDVIRRFYQRKCRKVHKISALNAVAHKLARASYYIMRDGVLFDVNRAFV